MEMRWNSSNVQVDPKMSGRFLFGILLLLSLAMLLFVAGFLCLQLGLGLLTGLLYAVAGKLLLLAFALLFLLGMAALFMGVLGELRAYFGWEAVALRRIWSVQGRLLFAAQRAALETRQMRNLSMLKRQRLLAANNKKHLRVLHGAIFRELQAAKSRLPEECYRMLCQDLRKHRKHANAEAMLALRSRIISG